MATFIGPTHVFFVPAGPRRLEGLSGKRVLCNPGSVGQPRDGDPLASYAIHDGDSLEFFRVPYALREAQRKIRELPVDPDIRSYFADRLATGE